MKYLYLAAPPGTEAEAFAAVRDRVQNEFGIPVMTMQMPDLEFAYDGNRRQYASFSVLELLLRLCPANALKLLAVTECDLFIPVLTFVFGHAQLGGRVGVISFARLRQEFYGLVPHREVFLERAYKEALHETGHTFGLVHCPDRNCAMSLATNVRQIDLKQAAFCGPCSARLARRKEEELS
jgi:archaemetzincin